MICPLEAAGGRGILLSGGRMHRYSEAAWERTVKVQDVILRAVAKRITWWQAAEILGISDAA